MNKVTQLPNKITVKILKEQNVLIAELPEYDLHTEADTIWELVSNVNDIIKLYFNIPSESQTGIIYFPPIGNREPEVTQISSIDFLKYLHSQNEMCLQ